MFDLMVQWAEGKVKYCVQVQSHATLAAILCNEMFAIHIIIYIYVCVSCSLCVFRDENSERCWKPRKINFLYLLGMVIV